MQLNITGRDGTSRTVDASAGKSVMETIRAAGFDEMLALCGGSCVCGTCHVYVDADTFARLDPPTDMERDLLENLIGYQDLSRLSCQIRIDGRFDKMAVTIGPEQE